MSRRSNSLRAAPVSLFPFLAVLICTMGTLIVLLVVVVQQAQMPPEPAAIAEQEPLPSPVTAAEPPADAAETVDLEQEREALQMALEDAQWAQEQLVISRENTRQRMEDRRGELSRVEDQARTLSASLDVLEKQAADLLATEAGHTPQDERLEEELATLRIEIADTEQALAKAQERLERGKRQYALIPYEGPYGTKRRPIYIECQADLVVLQPDGVAFGVDDLTNVGPDNPLAVALRATREYLSDAGLTDRVGEPYPLLIVRPGGVCTFSACRNALSGWDDEYGYELLPEEMELTFPPVDTTLGQIVRNAVDRARALAGIQPPGAGHGRGAGNPAAGGDSFGIGERGDALAAGGQPPFPTAGAAGPAGVHGGSAGTRPGSDAANLFGDLGSESSGSGSGGSATTPTSMAAGHGGGSGHGGSSQTAGQLADGGMDSIPGTGKGTGEQEQERARARARALGLPAGRPVGAEPVRSRRRMLWEAAQRRGPAVPIFYRHPTEYCWAANLTTWRHPVSGGGQAGSPGTASTSGQMSSGSAAGGAADGGQRLWCPAAVLPRGLAAALVWGAWGPHRRPQDRRRHRDLACSCAARRETRRRAIGAEPRQNAGRQLGTPQRGAGRHRNIAADPCPLREGQPCAASRFGAGQRVSPIGFRASVREAIQPLVSNIWNEIDRWGIAGPGVYWKPVLQVSVEAGAEPQFAEMAELLRDSGLEIRRR